ncbi:VOC family protein [Thermoclostridium caenicola]|uniref:Catechol 2,3-dioxygenase n=1 Tax=Thermoclostridium caenicola TaxID=659425 RepID=A0A1M6H7F5_9FIRM|nr:VOC family protein [Thermoclostridium caenicola]SHJ18127.1 Catechol 2,3-dioxygenase [Thermoclostridium caenicola]
MHIQYHSPVLMVKDIEKSRWFYEKVLKQEVEVDHGLHIVFKGRFCLWQADYAYSVVFGKSCAQPEKRGCEQLEMYFESDSLDEVFKALKVSGVEFLHEAIEQPWGQRVFRVYDPDRNVVEIAQPMEAVVLRLLKTGMSEQEVAQRTSEPIEMVQEVRRKLAD